MWAQSGYLCGQRVQEHGEDAVHVLRPKPAEFVVQGAGRQLRPLGMGRLRSGSSARLAQRYVLAAEPGPVAPGPLGFAQGLIWQPVTILSHIVTVP